jgi:fimbrial chaperone protein
MIARYCFAAAAALALTLAASGAKAQALTVEPVSIRLEPGQMASTLTVTNQGDTDTAFQIRGFTWSQQGDEDKLDPTDELLVSPPIGSIAAGASQVVRVVLRHPPQDREATYRILFDQIPPPAEAGTVRFALRLSIPIFALPTTRVAPHLQWRIVRDKDAAYLVGLNDGNAHERVREIALATPNGVTIKADANQLPYILAGATRRWRLITDGSLPAPGTVLHLSAQGDTSAIDTPVSESQ